MCFRLDQLTTRGTRSMYIFASTNDLFYKHNSVVPQTTRKFATRYQMSWHERQAHAGTICELAPDFRESRTTDNSALTMKRALAGSHASCSSSLSTLLFANACCSPTVYYSFVQRCVLPEKNSSNSHQTSTYLQPHPKLWLLLRHIWSWKPKSTCSWSGKAPKSSNMHKGPTVH